MDEDGEIDEEFEEEDEDEVVEEGDIDDIDGYRSELDVKGKRICYL